MITMIKGFAGVLFTLFFVSCSYFAVFAAENDRAQPGRYLAGWRTVTITRPNSTTFTARLYYPATQAGQETPLDPAGAPFPAITFGHGFFQAVSTYQSTLEHLATHGYFVIATNSESGLFPNHQNFANDLRFSLTFLEQENSDPGSVLFGRVAINKFGASGHSMGGGASILASAQDARIRALANLAAAETNPSAKMAMTSVNVPFSLISASADTIVPVATNGQDMYNRGRAPKLLPIIQGGWHCGFQDANGIGCDNGTIQRAQQLAETRRLLTTFFDLYLKQDISVRDQVWGSGLFTPLVTAERNSGIGLSPLSQEISASVGVNVSFQIAIENMGDLPVAFRIEAAQRRWIVNIQPATTAVIAPKETATVTLSTRRLWKNLPTLNELPIVVTKAGDPLTASFAKVHFR